MKLIKFLNQEGTNLLSDSTNQTILTLLVSSEYSVSELSAKLKLPTLKTWRRMQKLANANLVELSRVEKVGNIEKKFYRATSTWFSPQQFFNFKPKDANLIAAFEIYSNFQKNLIAKILELDEVPKGADPIDFSLFANMQAFAQVWGDSAAPEKMLELKHRLSKYKESKNFLEK